MYYHLLNGLTLNFSHTPPGLEEALCRGLQLLMRTWTQFQQLFFSLFLFKIHLFVMYPVFCLHVSLQARKWHQISLQVAVSHCGCWELN